MTTTRKAAPVTAVAQPAPTVTASEPVSATVRRSPNAWWCPFDGTSMPIQSAHYGDGPMPCPVCGATLSKDGTVREGSTR